MPKKQLGLRERNRIRTRDEILAAMSELLGERSYQSITLDEVAEQAGVSRGTIYTYFPDGRDQLLGDAYQRIADRVAAEGSAQRDEHTATVDRILALASALASISGTPEGRFYGAMGPDATGPLVGRTGSASRLFHSMLVDDLSGAAARGELGPDTPVQELAVLLSGALREIALTTSKDPDRQGPLLAALRMTLEALLTKR